MREWLREELHRALGDDSALRRQLAESVLSRVHIEVAFALRTLNRMSVVDLMQHRDDLIQACVLYLYENSGKVLRAWDPDAGMTLSSFIGLVVRRRVYRVFRYKRSNPAATDALAPEDLDALLDSAPPALKSIEEEIQDAVNLAAVRKCVEGEGLNDRDRRLYRAFYVDERAAPEICATEAMSQDGFHQALKRVRERIKHCLDKKAPRGARAQPPGRQPSS